MLGQAALKCAGVASNLFGAFPSFDFTIQPLDSKLYFIAAL